MSRDGPKEEPGNLGPGWVGFDFEQALGKPVRMVNDAAMQALGGYTGGRMLFLGLGTGLGSALVLERIIIPLELGRLRWGLKKPSLFEFVGKEALKRIGRRKWERCVLRMAEILRQAFVADYVVLGGGNGRKVCGLTEHLRCGGNEDAFAGGFRLWDEDVEQHEVQKKIWRVVR